MKYEPEKPRLFLFGFFFFFFFFCCSFFLPWPVRGQTCALVPARARCCWSLVASSLPHALSVFFLSPPLSASLLLQLALVQTENVRDRLAQLYPHLNFPIGERIPMKEMGVTARKGRKESVECLVFRKPHEIETEEREREKAEGCFVQFLSFSFISSLSSFSCSFSLRSAFFFLLSYYFLCPFTRSISCVELIFLFRIFPVPLMIRRNDGNNRR